MGVIAGALPLLLIVNNIQEHRMDPLLDTLILSVLPHLMIIGATLGILIDMNLEEYNADSYAIAHAGKDGIQGLKKFAEKLRDKIYNKTLPFKTAAKYTKYAEENILYTPMAWIMNAMKDTLVDPLHPSIQSRIDRFEKAIQDLEAQELQA